MPDHRRPARKHVVAVNSSDALLDVLRDLFEDEGYAVTTANFRPETFDRVAALRPDALIVDLAVGERAGWDLLGRLHEESATRGIPVLVVSTDARLLDRAHEAFPRFGARRYLAKPFAVEAILAAVADMAGGG